MLVVAILAAWFVLAVGAALLLGGVIRLADQRAPYADGVTGMPDVLTVDHILAARSAEPSR
jgi:hypothetical protein